MGTQAVQSEILLTAHKKELASLRALSEQLGSDPLLVQANNGNTSIKLDGKLWIKASGKWLANAQREEIFIPVDLAAFQESLAANVDFSGTCAGSGCLRPSIETAMHGVLPHRVVLHVHSVNTIAWAVRRDGPGELAGRLDGLHWKWVPYVPSGMPLAREIEKLLIHAPKTNVFVLGNHGLVVCGDDCEGAEALLWEVERRLAVIPRVSADPAASLAAIVYDSLQWGFPDDPELHALGTDAVSRHILKQGVLYPCQAMFLGATINMLPYSASASWFRDYFHNQNNDQAYAIIEGGGAIVKETIDHATYEMLRGLMHVVQRIDQSAPLRYLTELETASALSGAQSYRSPHASDALHALGSTIQN
jgi:rhamnose utilization protein RhaD (predicted bifunctional aldolase and dehydrogenase)